MAGTYSTNLTTFLQASSGETWVEPANNTGYNDMRQAQTVGDTDDYIQGLDCVSGQPGPANGAGVSALLGVNTGSPMTVPSDGAILTWIKYDASVGLNNTDGVRMCIGDANNSFYVFFHFGQENYTYGGWKNLAQGAQDQLGNVSLTNPTIAQDAIPSGTPANQNYTYVGWAAATSSTPGKGQGYKVDAVRYGRCDIIITGGTGTAVDNTISGRLSSSAANFAQIAEFNDHNGGTAGGGVASTWTDVDSGRHRLGIFQEISGGYLYKGLLSIGTAATATYFDAANENINIDDTRKVTDAFNTIEIRNTGSTVIWDTVQIVSNAIRSPGNLEVIDNATVTFTGCSFTNMGTFIFNDGTNPNTLSDVTFRSTGQITSGGATFTSCSFLRQTSAITLLIDGVFSDVNKITNSEFVKNAGNNNQAVYLNNAITTDSTIIWDGNTISGYTAYATNADATGQQLDVNAVISAAVDAGVTLTVSVRNTGGILPSVEQRTASGGNIVVSEDVVVTISGLLGNTEISILNNPSPYTQSGTSPTKASPNINVIAAVTGTDIELDTGGGANVTQIISTTTDFTDIGSIDPDGLVAGDFIRVTQRNNLAQFDVFEVVSVSTNTIDVIDVATTSINQTDLIDSPGETVTVEKIDASHQFTISSGAVVDILLFRVGSLPVYLLNQTITASNASFPVTQSLDRNFKAFEV